MATLGQQVKELRLRAGLTQLQLAHAAECDPTSVSRLERDLIRPHASTIAALAKALGVSVDALQPAPALAAS